MVSSMVLNIAVPLVPEFAAIRSTTFGIPLIFPFQLQKVKHLLLPDLLHPSHRAGVPFLTSLDRMARKNATQRKREQREALSKLPRSEHHFTQDGWRLCVCHALATGKNGGREAMFWGWGQMETKGEPLFRGFPQRKRLIAR